ncbi:MAG: cytochrome c [Deltaproteobacteria bacterium]|nr:cytochrome c [Deltaproteobacteria bacterium]
MRAVVVLAIAIAGACAAPSDRERFLDDREFRRAALSEQLVTTTNDYGRARLAHFGKDWDDLPVWNPTALDLDVSPDDRPALRTLGEQAFFGYPTQLWQAGGDHLVRVETAAGVRTAATCATCHAGERDGVVVPGLASMIDVGLGPGRVDVTTPDGREPLRIPDLRPVREQRYLQASAAVRQRDVISLAVRIETLIITAHHETVRPPPIVALALAEYLWSLAPPPPAPPRTAAEVHGATLFAARCATCHEAGERVPVGRVGTDPVAAQSRDRGTGMYRAPSLRGVADRLLLLHDGSVHSLADLLDPARVAPGHRFGTTLPAADRADLVAFLSTL